jgi:hypothetical protein
MKNQKHRNQAADLILRDQDDNHLVFTSAIEINPDRSMSFQVGEDSYDGARYKVTLKIEEVLPPRPKKLMRERQWLTVPLR